MYLALQDFLSQMVWHGTVEHPDDFHARPPGKMANVKTAWRNIGLVYLT